MLEPTFVTSSNINAIAHEGDTLYIRFNSGITYRYDGVPHASFSALSAAESVGQHFHRFIRGRFKYTPCEVDPFSVTTH